MLTLQDMETYPALACRSFLHPPKQLPCDCSSMAQVGPAVLKMEYSPIHFCSSGTFSQSVPEALRAALYRKSILLTA